MEKKLIYENILELETPVGKFAVFNGADTIPFSVSRNIFDLPLDIRDKAGNVIDMLHTEYNYTLEINPEKLELHTEYEIRFIPNKPCEWEHCGSDEYTTCYATVIDGWAVGIGAFDPNEPKKGCNYMLTAASNNRQGNVPEYEELGFVQYTVDDFEDDGYKFILIDYTGKGIFFNTAWIHVNEYPVYEYEEALGYWLS